MRRPEARERGQALPLALALALLLLLGAVALFALGRVQLASARAQTAADLGAVSAARELRGRLGEVALAGPAAAASWRRRLAAVADAAARPAGARVEGLALPGGSWPPTAVEVTVSVPGPRDARVRAIARAGLVVSAVAGDGRTGWATGGGYSGPLVYRDGKPMCPAVGAAFDLMDAAAGAEGVDLVVVSGFRSDAEQAVLFARHPDPKWVAPPGRSRHRDATELDLNMHNGGGGAYAWLSRNGSRFGFVQRYSWEPWHWGYLPGCGGGAAAAPAPGTAAAPGALPGWVPPRYRVGDRRGGGGERGRARPPGGAAAVRVRLRPARREPGRRPGDRPAHAGHGPGPRGARPLRPVPGDPGGGAAARRPPTGVRFGAAGAGGLQRRAGGGAPLRRRASLPRDAGLRRPRHRARREAPAPWARERGATSSCCGRATASSDRLYAGIP